MRLIPARFRPFRATLRALCALCCAALPGFGQLPSWTEVYSAPPGHAVDLVVAVASSQGLRMLVTGSEAQIAEVAGGLQVRTPVEFQAPAGVASRFYSSPGGSSLARADFLSPDSPTDLRLHLLQGNGVAPSVVMQGPAHFLLSDSVQTVVAYRISPRPSGGGFVNVHDADGSLRALPWAGELARGRVLGLQLSRDGARLAIRRPGSTHVYDCTPDAERSALYRIPSASQAHFDAAARHAAVLERDAAVFYREGVEILRVSTALPPIDVAFDDAGNAAVIDPRNAFVARLDPPSVLTSHAAAAGAEFRSVACKGETDSGLPQVAIGVRRGTGPGWQGWALQLDLQPLGATAVQAWPQFDFQNANRRSPQVRYLEDGRLLAWSRDRVMIASQGR
jgi:hypothetical protein